MENLGNPDYLKQRAILAPTIDEVDLINDHLLSMIQGEEVTYLSADSSDMDDFFPPEILNMVKCSGCPNHELKLKVGVPVRLLMDINPLDGLSYGTRLVITSLGKFVIRAKVMSGRKEGEDVFIPRLDSTPSDEGYPFKMKRRQFPLSICFAMTLDQCRGQSSLSHVGFYSQWQVFSRERLSVELSSRLTSREGLEVLMWSWYPVSFSP